MPNHPEGPDAVSDDELLQDALALGALAGLASPGDESSAATEAANEAAAAIVDKYKQG